MVDRIKAGKDGTDGERGKRGKRGHCGKPGHPGIGTRGAPGPTGPCCTGPTGSQGPTGATGPCCTGPTGPTGSGTGGPPTFIQSAFGRVDSGTVVTGAAGPAGSTTTFGTPLVIVFDGISNPLLTGNHLEISATASIHTVLQESVLARFEILMDTGSGFLPIGGGVGFTVLLTGNTNANGSSVIVRLSGVSGFAAFTLRVTTISEGLSSFFVDYPFDNISLYIQEMNT